MAALYLHLPNEPMKFGDKDSAEIMLAMLGRLGHAMEARFPADTYCATRRLWIRALNLTIESMLGPMTNEH